MQDKKRFNISSRNSVSSVLNIPNIVLRSVFTCTRDGLNLCLVNAGSVFPKINVFRRVFETSNAHIIVVPETWFKRYRSNASIAFEGYDVLRNDRVARRSGGIAVYIKKGIKSKVVASSMALKSEYLFFEVIFPNHKILFGSYYKAPNVDEIDEFEAVLSDLSVSYNDVIVLGDFNENLLTVNSMGVCSKCVGSTCSVCRFLNSLVKFGLKSIGDAPTNFDGQPSLIDLMLSNRPEKFSLQENQIGSGLSNHDLVFATFIGPDISLQQQPATWRNYREINVDNLLSDIRDSNLDAIFNCTDVNSMLEIFDDVIVSLLNQHAPLIPFEVKSGINSTKGLGV